MLGRPSRELSLAPLLFTAVKPVTAVQWFSFELHMQVWDLNPAKQFGILTEVLRFSRAPPEKCSYNELHGAESLGSHRLLSY
jgi:hypothetical protein